MPTLAFAASVSYGPEATAGLWQLLLDVKRGGRMDRLTTDIGLE